MPRQPILSVLGHVDAGKTTLLDKIRESEITSGEAGGITQMIGATEVPIETLHEVCGPLLDSLDTDLTIPGIMFIDTPGHAAFSSLRKRGGSISDIGVLVVDVNEGLQPQTEEAVKILKESNTPFVIALNKIDTLNGWKSKHDLFTKNLQEHGSRLEEELDEKIYNLMGELAEYDINANRFDRIDDFQKKAAIVPVSAETGEGIPELLMVIAGLSQRYLQDQLEVHEGIGRGTVLEVSQEKGLGTTIDVIHYDGTINKDDTLVYGTIDGVKTTKIRALLQPRPLQEIRLEQKYEKTEKVEPASGIKIAGKDLEGIISGSPIRTAGEENLEEAKKEVEEELEAVQFETQKQGVVVKADSLGSLEAVMREVGEINVQKAEVGDVKKSDIIEVQNEEPGERAVLAFDVGVTEQAQQVADDKDVKIFNRDIIYELFDNYQEWKEELQEKKREKALEAVPRPAKIRTMPEHIFRSSKPVVIGCKVEEGVLKPGSILMDMDGEIIGEVKSVQEENESVEKASKGSQVAVSIKGATEGRDFEAGDRVIVNLSRENYRRLQELEDLLSTGEKQVLEEIVEIQDSKNPQWKIG